jgi:hypothetical protein
VIQIERKTKILMISTAVVLAILSGIAALAYAKGLSNASNTSANTLTNDTNTAVTDPWNFSGGFCGGRHGFGERQPPGWGNGGFITASQEFKDNVINITKSDPDVQNLLTEGYNLTEVRPIISTTVEADGTISMKATSAIATLTKNTTGRAFVWVNVEQAKVTRIEILTRTVIEKT